MLFVIHLLDKPDSEQLRTDVRPEHKEYLGRIADNIAFAGPLFSDDGKHMIGSLLVINFDSRDSANAWLQLEPFTKAGLYASVSVHAFSNLWSQKIGFPNS